MAVNNRHRQQVDFSKHLDSRQNRSPNNDLENLSVKYVNNRCSPNQLQNSNSASDQKTITITVKKKKQKMKENEVLQRFKKSKETGLITICDYLKILAKKCSTPEAHHAYVHRHQKRRSSDTCLNMSTPFKTKTVVNTMSIDPKRIPPDCKNLLNHPLMQAQLSIYRCQLNGKKNSGCKTCNSATIFEVVKCLYDCYKKKKCDPCKCVVCGYLPKDIRKLIHEVGRSHASVGVETASTNQKTRSTMTSQEDELLSMLQSEPKPEKDFRISASEKLRMAKAFGILTPPESQGVKLDRAYQGKNNADYMTEIEPTCPEVDIQLDKMLYMTNQPDTGPTLRVPSKKLRKARASGLLTPLEGKTQHQREKMLRHLAMNDIPLPEGKTESEKKVITKVRRELGLPPGPRTAEEKERYAKAQAAGLITPLKGKSQPQKENILRSLLENGLPLPEGRTPQEKALISKIELECLLNPVTKPATEKKIKHRARSYVHTLFNKFATETGYMVLVETSCVKDKFNLQAKGFLTPIEVRSPKEETNILHLTRPKETKSLEKALFKEVEIGVRLIPESQGKTQIRKLVRRTRKESVEPRDGPVVSKKFIKTQPDSRTALEERIAKSKDNLLASTVISGNPLLDSRTSLENLFDQKVNNKARSSNVIVETPTRRTKLSKSESEQAKVIKSLANARLSLTKEYVPSEKQNINKVRDKPKVIGKKTCQACATGTAVSQKISKGMVTKLISKLVSHINEDLDNTRAGAVMCERGVACDTKKLSFRKSYLTIKLSLSDVSNVTTPRKTRSVFTDTKDIRQLSDIATSIPSILNFNSTLADETEPLDNVPTKEIKKNKNKSLNDQNQTLYNEDANSTFRFHYASDTDDTESQSHDNNARYLDENADLIYIYKPTFEYNAKGMLTPTSRIILTDSYNISPTSSGSLYLIETGSTESCDSGTTDYSYATKDQSETETGTDVFYLQQSEDDNIDTSSEPRILWFYRNSIHKTGRPAGRDTKIYLVSEVKMHQQREPAQQRKKQHCNLHSPDDVGVVRTAPRQSLKRASSIVLVMPPSRSEMSTEDLGSLIYVEKLDSVSKLKTIKIVPHENSQTVNPIKMFRRHTRIEEKIKPSVEPRTGKCTITRPVPASHKLPVTNAFTKCPCQSISNRENKLEYSSEQLQKPRIPPKYSEYSKMTTEPPSWNKELYPKQPSCSTTCRLDMCAEQRIGRSEQQRTPPRYIETGPKSTESARGHKDPLYKALARYLHSTKRIVCKEKPEQRITSKNSKVCLISATHSSIYRVHSKVSFSDELRYVSRGNSSELCMEKCLDPSSPKKSPCQGPNECKNAHDHSLCCSSDEKTKRLREKIPQFTIKIAPKSSKSNIKSPRSAKGSKVRFDRQLHSCCPCEKTASQKSDPTATIDELRPCAYEKKTIIKSEKEPKPCCRKENTLQQSESDLSKNESKPCEKKKTDDTDVSKNESVPYLEEKKTEQSESDSKKKECTPCENEKTTPEQSDYDSSKNESKPCENEKVSQPCDTDASKNESKPCESEKKTSEQSDSDSSRNEPRPREKNKTSHQCDTNLLKNESKRCEKEAENNKKTIDQQPDPESTCKTVAKETKKDSCVLESPCSDMGSTDEQSILTKESSSQCRETVKRAISPMNVDVKSIGVDGSSTLKPSCLVEKPKAVCPEKDKTPEKPLYICDRGSSANFRVSENICTRKKPTTNSTEKQPSDKSVELEQQTKSEHSEPKFARVPSMQPTNECVKQQIITEEYCPLNLTPDQTAQPANVCDKLKEKVASECRAELPNSISQSADENVKLKQQTPSKCPADSTQDSLPQPAGDNAKICKQTASECQANSIQEPIILPADKSTKSIHEVVPKSPANFSKTQLAKENDKSKQQLVSECPANSVQDGIQQPAKEKDVLNQNIPCQPPVKSNNDTVSEQPAQVHPDPPAKSKRKTCSREPLTQLTEPKSKPCSKILKYVSASDNKDKHQGRVWWCKKKQALLHRRGHPPPLRSVEDNSMETQCERDVKDLAQMTDDILRMTDEMMGMKGDPEKCLCNVKPCKCLHEVAQTVTNGGSTTTKPTSECECPPPILIIKKNQQENYKNDANVLREQQQSLCSCIAFLQKHNLLYTGQEIVNQTATELKGLGQKSEQQADAPYIYSLNDFCHCQQNKTPSGANKAIGPCECGRSKPIEPTSGDQNNNDVTCQGITSGPGSKKKIICECPPPTATKHTTADQNGKGRSCPGMMSDGDGRKNITRECPRPKATELTAGGQNGNNGPCQGTMLGPGGKENLTSECLQPKAIEQNGNNGMCQGMMSEPSSNKNTTFECSQPTVTGLRAGGENGKVDICRCMLSRPGGKENFICECPPLEATEQRARGQNGKNGMCQGMSEPSGKKNTSFECPRQNNTDNRAGAENGNLGTCPGMPPGPGSMKNVICECPPLRATEQAQGSQYGNDGTCQCMTMGPGGKIKVTCECPPPKVTEQTAGGRDGKDGPCQCMTPGPGGKKSIICECPRQAPAGLTPGHICRNGTCQGVFTGPCGAHNTNGDGPRPTTIVKEQTTAVQCKKVEQRSCDNLAKVQSGKKSQNTKSSRCKKTVICESPSKDKLQLSQAPGNAPCPNTADSNKIGLSLKKKSPGQAGEGSSSEECTECQNKKTRVKWCQKKYVISECPPLGENDHCDSTCFSSQKKKQLKKNAKNQAKIKTREKKVDTSCTHGFTPCLCKDEPFCRLKKNHKCECPCPLFVEEVDLNPEKDCPPQPPCPKDCPPPPPPPPPCLATGENEKKSQKKNLVECDQGQMTQDKIDKCSYTDRPIKNICKTKNKSSGQGKWGKKRIPPCICPPEPPTTETGCDPPCVKEQWKMKSRETCNKSGFSVKKKPAARVDHTMCFEEALAYFELHPEDDPMQKKKMKKVICECPSSDFCDSFVSTRTLPYCISRL